MLVTRSHVQLIEIINKIAIVESSWLFIVSMTHGHTNIKIKEDC